MDSDDLYGLALDRFVPERTALARSLRAQGRGTEAATVASLRKPSVAAWAVNQLVRTQRRAVQDLFAAGDALRAAQADVLAGHRERRVVADARERQRSMADRLLDAARGLLTSDGHELSSAVIDRVAETLEAAALDEHAREQVRAGRLQRELRHVGLGVIATPQPPRRAAKSTTRSSEPGSAPTSRSAARESAQRAAARKAASVAEARAARRAERAARDLEAAKERHARAARDLDDAGERLASARQEARAATEALRRARSDLKQS
jgi:hypothetical protein